MGGGRGVANFDGGRLCVDADHREVLLQGCRLDIAGRRFDLLMALLQRRDRVAGKDELLQAVWPARVIVDNNLEVHVAALRAAIATVRGRGYRWVLAPDPTGDAHTPPGTGEALFDRDGWLDAAARWLAPGAARIVTLHGAGGVCKTRLAATAPTTHRRCSCCVRVRVRWARTSMRSPPSATRRPNSAAVSTACRWRWSCWRRACACCRHARCRMLEPVREFALQCLAADGRLAQAQARHVEWFHAFVEHHAPRLCSRGRAAALVALRSERANLAAALRQLVREQPDAAAALRTTASLAWAWYFGGSLLEGRQWLREALALPGAPAHAVDLVRAHVVAARLSMYLFDVDDALAQAAAALQGARALGEARLQAEALFVQAIPMMARGPLQAAEVLHQSRELFAAASPSWATTGA